MPQVINSNIASLSSQRFLNGTQNTLSTALQRLSSGLRINSAKDDAAGLAISERFTSQVRGLNQAARNANDAISLLQTAEGALSTGSEQLQRMRELAIQAANSTNSATDRQALQQEVSQLLQEMDRIGTNTEFNGMRIFDQSKESVVGDADVLNVYRGLTEFGWLEQAEKRVSDFFGLQADGTTMTIKIGTVDGPNNIAAYVQTTGFTDGKGDNVVLQIDLDDFVPANFPNGGNAPLYNDRIIAHEMAHAVMARSTNYASLTGSAKWFVEGTAELIQGGDERVTSVIAQSGGMGPFTALMLNQLTDFAVTHDDGFNSLNPNEVNLSYAAGYVASRYLEDALVQAGSSMSEFFDQWETNPSLTFANAVQNALGTTVSNFLSFDVVNSVAAQDAQFQRIFGAGWSKLANTDTGAIGGADASGGPTLTAESVIPTGSSRPASAPLEGFNVVFDQTVLDALGEKPEFVTQAFQVGANANQTLESSVGSFNTKAMGIDSIDLETNAQAAISALDRALDYVSSQRGVLGAQLNRLDSTIRNLSTTSENISAARSRIVDTDFAQETANLTKSQILQQAASAMLAQANNLPQNVLSLLRG